MALRLLHLADVHFGMENYGRLDAATGLNRRLLDFARSVHYAIDYALDHGVHLAIFAGDIYKHRDPDPSWQREFAVCVRKLTDASVPVVILVGNHDLPNTAGKAHAVEIFATLSLPGVTVISQPGMHLLDTAAGRVQVVGMPYITRSFLLSREEYKDQPIEEVNRLLVDKAEGTRALRAVHHAFGLHEPRPNGASAHALDGAKAQPADAMPLAASSGQEGREIMASLNAMEDIVVSDVELDVSQGRITIFRAPDRPGICSRIFQAIAQAGIVVDMIVQNLTEEGRGQLSFSVPQKDLPRALAITQQTMQAIDPSSAVAADPDMARVHVSGVGMRTHTGVARRMFGALAGRGINISMISTSEIRVGVVVDLDRGPEALAALKAAFNLA